MDGFSGIRMDLAEGLKIREWSSKYRGVQKVNRDVYVAYVYSNGLERDGGQKADRVVYLGTFENEEYAARAYDLVSLKYWGIYATTNFPISYYEEELLLVAHMTDQEILTYVRRQPGSRNWLSNKGKCKEGAFHGTYNIKEEAGAMAFDVTTTREKGLRASTNFGINQYNAESIRQGKLPLVEEEPAKKMKAATSIFGTLNKQRTMIPNLNFKKEDEIAPISDTRFSTAMNNWYLEMMKMKGSTTSGFRHSSSSPFRPYKRPAVQHSSSSGFQAYKPVKHEDSFVVKKVIATRPSFQAPVTDEAPSFRFDSTRSHGEEEEEGRGSRGFQHSNSSCFKPYASISKMCKP